MECIATCRYVPIRAPCELFFRNLVCSLLVELVCLFHQVCRRLTDFARCVVGYSGRDCSFVTGEAQARQQLLELVLSSLYGALSTTVRHVLLSRQVLIVAPPLVERLSYGAAAYCPH
jgi:hypothetical protein